MRKKEGKERRNERMKQNGKREWNKKEKITVTGKEKTAGN